MTNIGWEQEYFLISRENFNARPDLQNCGRTLFGAMPGRSQEGAENYFAPPYPLARQFMEEVRPSNPNGRKPSTHLTRSI